MKINKTSIFIFILVFSASFFIGLIVNDLPYFSIDSKVRPIEFLTFLFVTSFGYWFQHNQRKINSESSVLLKILEEVLKDISKDTDSIISIIEDFAEKELDDTSKKKIHLKIKNISFGVQFISENTTSDLSGKFLLLKDSIISEEFSGNKFIASTKYLKEINICTNDFRMNIRKSICTHIRSL